MTRKTLAADMWPSLTFADANKVYGDFLANGRPRIKGFLESVLLYDEVHVPTDSFMSLAIIVGVLGERPTHELLDSGTLKFLHFNGALAYAGNGGGLTDYSIGHNPGNPVAMFGATQEAANWALSGLNSHPDVSSLLPKVARATSEMYLKDHLQSITARTYAAINSSDGLRQKFSIEESDLSRLAGIAPNQIRVWPGYDEPGQQAPDGIDAVLRVARSYVEAAGAEHIGNADVSTATPIGYVIEDEEAKAGLRLSGLHQITKIPDLGEDILVGRFSVEQLLKLKQSYDWPKFRDWFHEHCTNDPIETAKAYVDLLKTTPGSDSLVGRSIRFLATTAIGLLNPVAGVAAAAADTYLVPRAHPPSAKFFIERLEQVTKQQAKDA